MLTCMFENTLFYIMAIIDKSIGTFLLLFMLNLVAKMMNKEIQQLLVVRAKILNADTTGADILSRFPDNSATTRPLLNLSRSYCTQRWARVNITSRFPDNLARN